MSKCKYLHFAEVETEACTLMTSWRAVPVKVVLTCLAEGSLRAGSNGARGPTCWGHGFLALTGAGDVGSGH